VLSAADSSDDTSINLNWTESQTSYITGYVIEREPAGGSFTTLATITDPTTASYQDATAVAGLSYSYEIEAYDTVGGVQYFGGFSNIAVAALPNPAPTVATAASATVSADGKSIALSVLGADALGESSLTYTWTATTLPQGAATPVILPDGTNAAKNSVASISAIGDYTFTVTITDTAGFSISTTASASVGQVLTAIAVTPSGTAILPNTSQQFSASAIDQFGNAMASQPVFNWSVGDPALGTITSSGLFEAGSTFGSETVSASSAAVSGITTVTVSPISSNNPLAAVALDSSDVEAYWLDLPSLSNGATLEVSEDSTFATGVTSASIAAHTTSYEASGLSPQTTYYFQLLPAAGTPVVGTASATTPAASRDGSGSVIAPVITAQASYTQISPTVISLTMTAASTDPLSYSWQVFSAPDGAGAPYIFDDEQQTADVALQAAGTYVFEATATDEVTGLSTTSDVTADVAQVATSFTLEPTHPGSNVISLGTAPDGDDNPIASFDATELDQFGNAMTTQPAISWSVADPTLVTFDTTFSSGGLGIFDPTNWKVGTTNITATGGTFSSTAQVFVGARSSIGEISSILEFPMGTIVSDQNPQFTVSSPSAQIVSVDPSGLDWHVYPSSSNAQTVEVDVAFTIPVNSVTFSWFPDSTTPDLTINLYTNGAFAGKTNSTAELSRYKNVTSLQIVGDSFFPPGNTGGKYVLMSGLEFNPVVVYASLGDASANQILQASDDGTQHLVPLNLFVPADLANGTVVTLSTTAASEVDVWNTPNPTAGSPPLLGGDNGGTTSWTVGSGTIPTTLYVGATQASQSVGDVQFTLSFQSPGVDSPSPTSTTLAATSDNRVVVVAGKDLGTATAGTANGGSVVQAGNTTVGGLSIAIANAANGKPISTLVIVAHGEPALIALSDQADPKKILSPAPDDPDNTPNYDPETDGSLVIQHPTTATRLANDLKALGVKFASHAKIILNVCHLTGVFPGHPNGDSDIPQALANATGVPVWATSQVVDNDAAITAADEKKSSGQFTVFNPAP
jgi:hypothetical protein